MDAIETIDVNHGPRSWFCYESTTQRYNFFLKLLRRKNRECSLWAKILHSCIFLSSILEFFISWDASSPLKIHTKSGILPMLHVILNKERNVFALKQARTTNGVSGTGYEVIWLQKISMIRESSKNLTRIPPFYNPVNINEKFPKKQNPAIYTLSANQL